MIPAPEDRKAAPPPALLVNLAALAGYALLSIVVTWPTIRSMTSRALGELYIDQVQNIWNLWWVKVALLDRHTNPFQTDLLFYPQGADLYFHTLSLPSTLITLIPELLWGPVAAFNFGMMTAITLSGYSGFRLVRYLTGSTAAGLVGGLVLGFNPMMQSLLKGQINVLSLYWFVLCIEFYLRTWAGGGRRTAVLLGLCFTLAVLTVGYYEILLLVFFIVHGLWALATAEGATAGRRLAGVVGRARPALIWGGGTAALLLAPYLIGAALSLQRSVIFILAAEDATRTLLKSFDLLSFVLPSAQHWLLGAPAPWWEGIHLIPVDTAYLGVITVGLAGVGAWRGRRLAWVWFWGALIVLGLVLSLGPVLHINGQDTFAGVQIPLPFQLLQQVPVLSLLRAPERFCFLAYLGLAVLAGDGLARLLAGRDRTRRGLITGLALGLLVLEMPLYPRHTEALPTPDSLAILGRDPAPGAVVELPLTQHGGVEANRMLYQTVHGRPMTSGYLSRTILDPYTQACSPLQVLAQYTRLPAKDIVAPRAVDRLTPDLLTANGFGFLVVYKQVLGDWPGLGPLPASQLAPLQDVAARLGTPIADDALATTYRVRPTGGAPGLFLQLGPDWYQVEESYGQPFRWINGDRADLCIFNPAAQTAPLAFQVTSFARPRRLQIAWGTQLVLDTVVPADGALHALQTDPITWPAGPQLLRIRVPEGSDSPAELGQGPDPRRLSLGFAAIHLAAPPAGDSPTRRR